MKKIFAVLVGAMLVLYSCAQTIEEKAHQLMDAYVKNNRFNGTVLVARGDQMLFQRGYGYKNEELKKENNVNTIFQVGSITKQFTSAIIMQLQQEGKLSVKDRISKYFPDLPRANEITIENLLTHTSGIWNYTNNEDFMLNRVTNPLTEVQMIALFKDKPLDFEPGTNWSYSNSAYALLGYIITKVTNKPYERVVRERILGPLDMRRSGFDFTHLNTTDKAIGYDLTSNGGKTPSKIVDSTVSYSAGALYSTVVDLYKWDRSIYSNQILNSNSWSTTFTPFRAKYGYGWTVDSMYGRPYMAHGGGIHGFSSYILRFPTEKAVIILLDNTASSQLGKIARDLAAIAFNEPYTVPAVIREIKVDEKILKQYEGKYELTPDFNIKVKVKDGHLVAQATGQQEFDLFAESEDVFFLKVVDAKLKFVKDANGKIEKLILYQGGVERNFKRID